MSPAGCPRCLVPRTSVITLYSLLRGQRRVAATVFREQALLHCTALFRGQRECKQYNPAAQRAQASPSTLLYLKQIARALHPTFRRVWRRVAAAVFRERALLHCTTLFRGQRRRICFCGAHGTILSLAQNRGFCRQGVPAALFRENALPHYQAYCADSRDVILSRRECGASKNLLRLPRSSCNAIMPRCYTPHHRNPARSFDFAPRFTLGTSLRMTGRAACRRYRIPRKCVITLPSLLRGGMLIINLCLK